MILAAGGRMPPLPYSRSVFRLLRFVTVVPCKCAHSVRFYGFGWRAPVRAYPMFRQTPGLKGDKPMVGFSRVGIALPVHCGRVNSRFAARGALKHDQNQHERYIVHCAESVAYQ